MSSRQAMAARSDPKEMPVRKSPEAPRESRSAFLGDLLDTLTDRGRALLRRRERPGPVAAPDLAALGDLLLSRRGEASGVALARTLLAAFDAAGTEERLAFLRTLADRFGPDRAAVDAAIASLQREDAGIEAVEALHAAAEPRRQELIRRLNLAPGGTAALVRMREELLKHLRSHPELRRVDADFVHLLGSWFNRGFLVLRHIDWTTPANILEKIIRYEAVHAIRNWDDLRNRLEPTDRRCYGFFHPQLVDEPLIFVEVALTEAIPDGVAPLLDIERTPIEAEAATTAVFYSISTHPAGPRRRLVRQLPHQAGGRGAEGRAAEHPDLRHPVAGAGLRRVALPRARERGLRGARRGEPRGPGGARHARLAPRRRRRRRRCAPRCIPAAAHYFLVARDGAGRPLDPVARFHLGNGARLERLNFLGDTAPNGLEQSHGLMVNYLYALDEIEKNHEALAETGVIAASEAVRQAGRPTAA